MSKIKIYKTYLTPSRNALVDDLEIYLNSLTPVYVKDNFQYLKLGLDLNIKIGFGQEAVVDQSLGNYLRIEQDDKIWYYFILSVNWTAPKAVQLKLSIDSINTFRNDLSWSDKTSIVRQHKDRFNINNETFTFNTVLEDTTSGSFSVPVYSAPQLDGATNISYQILSKTGIYGPRYSLINFDYDNTIKEIKCYYSVLVPSGTAKVNVALQVQVSYKNVTRNIDFTPEAINAPLYGSDVEEITEPDPDSWYLIYNSNHALADKPVNTYLCKDLPFKTQVKSTAGSAITINAADLEFNKIYYIDCWNTAGTNTQTVKLVVNSNTISTSGSITEESELVPTALPSIPNRIFWYKCQGIAFYRSGDSIFILNAYGRISGGDAAHKIALPKTTEKQIQAAELVVNRLNPIGNVSPTSISLVGGNEEFVIHILEWTSQPQSIAETRDMTPLYDIPSTEYTEVGIDGIGKLNRTKSTLIKIINLPYCPLDYTVGSNGKIIFTNDVLYEEATLDETQTAVNANNLGANLIKLSNNVILSKILNTNTINPLKIISDNVPLVLNVNADKDIENETKLYHSGFYRPKVVYDSFALDFYLEKANKNQESTLNIKYDVSRNFRSTFLFTFLNYQTDLQAMDYDNIIVVNRNNEIPIYSSEYLNYIRNGYNYDVKAKEKNQEAAAVSTGLQIAGAVVSFLSSAYTGGAGVAAGISLLISATASIANNLHNTAAAEEAINQKLYNLKQQSTSVSNCDDIDILTAYSHNKAKVMVYQVSENVRQQIFDLFYYCGYTINRKAVPDFNSRYWFNYVQCEPTFIEEGVTPYNEYLDDIKARYVAGVTVYHHHDTWNWLQDKENWETKLLS